MINILMLVAMMAHPVPTTAKTEICVWPRVCAKPPVVAQIQPCIWPKCEKPRITLAQVGPCPAPKVCEKSTIATF